MSYKQEVLPGDIPVEGGSADSVEDLFERIYGELHRIAKWRMQGEPAHATLSTTALVHESYMRLSDAPDLEWNDREHFLALASRAMRHVLVDHARRRRRQKRGGNRRPVTLETGMLAHQPPLENVLSIHQALTKLEAHDERLGRVVECRFFGGLTMDETAGVLKISPRTAARDWKRASAYLAVLLSPG